MAVSRVHEERRNLPHVWRYLWEGRCELRANDIRHGDMPDETIVRNGDQLIAMFRISEPSAPACLARDKRQGREGNRIEGNRANKLPQRSFVESAIDGEVHGGPRRVRCWDDALEREENESKSRDEQNRADECNDQESRKALGDKQGLVGIGLLE